MVPDTADEAKWRAEFEAVGETQLRDGDDSRLNALPGAETPVCIPLAM
jgi:hypothetical protein